MTDPNFSATDVNWSLNRVSQCEQTTFTEFSNNSYLGSFNRDDNNQIIKTVSNLPPHWSLSVRFDLLLINYHLPTDFVQINLDSNSYQYSKQQPNSGNSFCHNFNILGIQYYEEMLLFYKNITHSSPTLAIVFKAQFSQAARWQEYGCLSCNQNLYLMNNQCVEKCPIQYASDKSEQNVCQRCHYKCKLGCMGVNLEDCHQINYYYQMTFYILISVSGIWIISSLFGVFLDKRQSKVALLPTTTSFPVIFCQQVALSQSKCDENKEYPIIDANFFKNFRKIKQKNKIRNNVQISQSLTKIDEENEISNKNRQTSLKQKIKSSSNIKDLQKQSDKLATTPSLNKTPDIRSEITKIQLSYIQQYNYRQIFKYAILGNE
ncbi:hypothetical protein ABPG74_005116 [Tetrahymena malaccensis]